MTEPTEITEMTDEEFRRLVDDDVRFDSQPQELRDDPTFQRRCSLLRHPDVVPRWFDALIQSKRSIEGQFGAEKKRLATLHYEVQATPTNDSLRERMERERLRYTKWKSGALRFNSGLETRIREARSLLPKQDPQMLMEEIVRLRDAIKQHQQGIDPDDASKADRELWNLVQ